MAQPLGVVYILVTSQPPENRLAQQPSQPMATVLAGTRIGQLVSSGIG